MNLTHDYIVAEQANMIDYNNIMNQIKGVFIGTKNYMFAIPYNMVNYTPGYNVDTTETTDMYYEGMPLQEFLLEKVKQPGLTVEQFERFMINEQFNDIQILNINTDMEKFKVQANFWGSGIMYNATPDRKGWKLFVLKYKKEKQAVRDFYENHPKRVEK